jgi:hypothetical protein
MNRRITSQPAWNDQEEDQKTPLFDPIPSLGRLSRLGLLLVYETRRSQEAPFLGPRLEIQRPQATVSLES